MFYPVLQNLAQLYVGDLDPSVREVDLYSLFKTHGEVLSIKLIKNSSPGSRSFAFISYKDQSLCVKVRRELNGSKLNDSVIRVCRVTRDRDPKGNIFIKNIPESASLQSLENRFSPFGLIVSSKIAHANGQSLGYGFIQFDHAFQAENAIKSMNNTKWEDNLISVCEYLPVSSRHFSNNSNLYIKNFPAAYDQDMIRSIFSVFGEIVSIGVINTLHQGKNKSFGFVCFKDQTSAEKAFKVMNGKKEEDFEWYVVPHMNRATRKTFLREQYLKQVQEWKLKNLYIRNLHFSICEKKLEQICREYGSITSLKILKNEHIKYNAEGEMTKEHHSKGVAFVCFELEVSAGRALKSLQEKTIEGVKVFVAKWIPRNELRFNILDKLMKKKNFEGALAVETAMLQRQANFFPPARRIQIPVVKQPQLSREMIGEQLYKIVVQNSNELVAGKITGMLLEMDYMLLVKLMKDTQVIRKKVLEAVEVLRNAWKDSPAQLKLLPEKL